MRLDPKLVEVVKKQQAGLRDVTLRPVGTIRVDISHLEQKTFEATYKTEEKSFQFLIDEPGVRGGQNKGPTPLGFFIAGAGS